MKTNWVTRTLARINSGELSEGEIRVIRQRLNVALSPYWRNTSRQREGISETAALEIWEAIRQRRPFVTNAQARKGAAWLYKVAFTPKGAQRSTALAREFTPADLEVIKSLQPAPVFSLVDFSGEFFPVYRACSDAGAFEYCAAAWQAGGAAFVTKHCPTGNENGN